MTESTDLLTEGVSNPTTSWREGIAEEHKTVVSKFNDVGSLAKGYVDLEKSMGGKVKIPTAESTPEEKSAFYSKLRPETAEGYEFDKPDLPEGMNYDEKFELTMRGIAHEAGITKDQMKALTAAFNQYQIEQFGDHQGELSRTHEEGEKDLRDRWAGDYDKNLEISRRALRELIPGELGEEFVKIIEETGMGNNPVMIRGFLEIGTKMLDDTFVRGEQAERKEEYMPAHPNSPEMYKSGETEEDKRARMYFTSKGHVYS